MSYSPQEGVRYCRIGRQSTGKLMLFNKPRLIRFILGAALFLGGCCGGLFVFWGKNDLGMGVSGIVAVIGFFIALFNDPDEGTFF